MPLGVGWLFQDVTEAKQAEQEASLLRFRTNQLHRAARAAAECEDPAEAATVHLDFALAGFADHALIDRVAGRRRWPTAAASRPVRLVRVAATPSGAPGPSLPAGRARAARCGTREGHPALQAWSASVGAGQRGRRAGRAGPGVGRGPAVAGGHGARAVRGAAQPGADAGRRDVPAGARARRQFERADAVVRGGRGAYRIAAALDLAQAAARAAAGGRRPRRPYRGRSRPVASRRQCR